MLRSLIVLLVLFLPAASGAFAAMWPEQLGESRRTSLRNTAVEDNALWQEYGLEAAETAEYAAGAATFSAAAYRLKDSTGALGVFQWRRPADAQPSQLQELAVETADGAVLAFGNYVFSFQGRKPVPEELAQLFAQLPRLEQSPLPPFASFLPRDHRVPNSERFVMGPVSLERFEPRISPSLAGFHFGVEAQLGRFRSPAGEIGLVILSYPTPHIARDKLAEFQKLPGAMAKRSGPLVAVVLTPPDADEAEKLLARVNYQATLTWNEKLPQRELGVAELLISIFLLIGLLLAFAIVAGLAFGGFRFFGRRWFGRSDADDPMILLHLSDR